MLVLEICWVVDSHYLVDEAAAFTALEAEEMTAFEGVDLEWHCAVVLGRDGLVKRGVMEVVDGGSGS